MHGIERGVAIHRGQALACNDACIGVVYPPVLPGSRACLRKRQRSSCLSVIPPRYAGLTWFSWHCGTCVVRPASRCTHSVPVGLFVSDFPRRSASELTPLPAQPYAHCRCITTASWRLSGRPHTSAAGASIFDWQRAGCGGCCFSSSQTCRLKLFQLRLPVHSWEPSAFCGMPLMLPSSAIRAGSATQGWGSSACQATRLQCNEWTP
jgi:hypothetical protein